MAKSCSKRASRRRKVRDARSQKERVPHFPIQAVRLHFPATTTASPVPNQTPAPAATTSRYPAARATCRPTSSSSTLRGRILFRRLRWGLRIWHELYVEFDRHFHSSCTGDHNGSERHVLRAERWFDPGKRLPVRRLWMCKR